MKSATLAPALLLVLAGCAGPQHATAPGDGMKPDSTEASLSDTARAYRAQCRADLADARNLLIKLEKNKGPARIDTVLEPLNDLSLAIDGTASRASLYRNVHPDAGMRQVAEWCEQEAAKLGTELSLSRPIFDAVAALDPSTADAETQRVVAHTLRDFRRAGVDKDPKQRARIRELQEELVRIGQDFSRNIRGDVREITLDSADDLAGLPADYIQDHPPGEDGKIRVTTDYPDYIPFMTYAKSDAKRLELYRAFNDRGWPKNDQVLREMLKKRHELAQALGYDSWAAYATEDKMIRNPEAAQKFIDRVADLVETRAEADRDLLLKRLKKDQPQAQRVGEWQKTYLAELVKRDTYAFDSQALRAYFPFKKVKQGILDLASRLFGVQIKPADLPVWHPDVEAYALWQGEQLLGQFYLDLHPRADKYKHAAVFDIQRGIHGRQLPVGVLVCNFPGGDGGPGLMDHNSVETFFHEFGHLLHHLFAGDHHWAEVSGIATEWDFVEAPSQLLEEWAWAPEVLKTFAVNADGEVLPDALIEKMKQARDFGLGLWVRQQMYYAALSLAYYTRDPDLDPTGVMEELAARYAPFEHLAGTHKQASFGHLFGYSSNYYTYMWSLVIAKDLFAEIQRAGMLDPEVVSRYRKAVLEPGGARDAADLVRDFLGRDFSFDAFAHWLEGA